MFNIVTTLEKGETNVVCVPKTWISGDTLMWPPKTLKAKKINKWRANQQAPGDDWEAISCTVRTTAPIVTYVHGMELEKMYSGFVDTDAELS